MANTRKRLLSLALVLVMVLSLLPIQTLAAESIQCTASDGAVITVTGDIPANAVITAVPVQVSLEGMKTLGAYDINITVDGEAWQPESPVEVNIESSAFEGYDELNVFHVETDQTPDYIDRYYSFKEQVMNFLKGLISQKIHSDVVSFMAEHFSIYAVGAPYVATYQFYDANDELIQSATQILKHGDTVQLPAAPAGDGIFQGWYIDGTILLEENATAEVPEEKDEIYNVYPKFDGVYYVTFYDTTGYTVVATIPVDATGTAAVGDAINTVAPVLQAGKILVGWSTTQDSNVANFTADTLVTGDMSVYPVLTDGIVVTFDSQGGSPSVTKVTAAASGIVNPPSDPIRSGFQFDGWYTESTGGDRVDFDSYHPNTSETLYAHWTASNTTYTVQYWAQNADDNEYTYAAAETVNGTAGAAISLTTNQKNPYKLDRTDSAGFTYSHNDSEGQTVAGDGSTIVNVYFNREIYTVKFWVEGTPETTCGKEEHTHSWWQGCYQLTCDKWWHIHGENCYNKNVVVCGKEEHTHSAACYGSVETDGGWYVWKTVTAKYGAYIGDQWPGSNWHIGKDESISQSFLSVMPLGGDDFYWRNSGDPGFNDYDKSSADYYVEALPGTEGTVSFDERSFVWHHTDSAQRSGLTITVEDFYDIAGFTQYRYTSGGQVYRPSHEGPTYNGAEFYYTRNSYTIDFYVDSEKLDSETVAYEAPISQALDDNIPSTPSQPGYTFEGWYLDPECETPVPDDMTMSDGNLAVYGRWVPPEVEVNIYYTTDSSSTDDVLTFSSGHVLEAFDLEKVVEEAATATHHNKDDFLGWYVQSGTGYEAYTFGSALHDDVTLYARWKGDTYTVTYQVHGGNSYADPGKYAHGSEAKVLTFEATGLTVPKGQEFSHWTSDSGTEVNPGQTLSISGDITLTAVFVDQVDVPTVTVTYDPNGGTGTDMTTEAMPVNSEFEAWYYPQDWTAPTGYKFKEWNTASDGSGVAYAPNSKFRADTAGNNVLYAQYEVDESQTKDLSYTVEYRVDSESGELLGSEPMTVEIWVNDSTYTVSSVPAKNFPGYKLAVSGSTELPAVVSDGDTIYVIYEKDADATKDLSYTVEYRVDSESGELLGSEPMTVEIWVNDSTYTVSSVPAKNFPGYKLAASGSTELPAVVSDGDTIYVIYEKDADATKDLSYTVEYRVDSESGELLGSEPMTVEIWVNDSTYTVSSVPAKNFPGYKLAASGSTELPAVVSDGDTIYVIYEKDADATKDLSYTVEYRVDSESGELLGSEPMTVEIWVNDSIYTVSSVPAKNFPGYKLAVSGSTELPAVVSDGDTIYVIYEKDADATKDLSYTVEYRVDSESGELLGSEPMTVEIWVNDSTYTVSSVPAKNFPGYKLAASGSTELPAVVSDGDTIYVIYEKDADATKDLSYTVEYRVDSESGELLGSEPMTVEIWVNDSTYTVSSVPTKNFPGYKLAASGSTELPAVVSDGDTIYVIYEKDADATKDLSYTVEYRVDSESGELLGSEPMTVEIWVNDSTYTVSSVPAKNFPGYKLAVSGSTELPAVVSDGDTIYVIYEKDADATKDLSYTVEYRVDSESGELLGSEPMTVEIWVNDSTYTVSSVPTKNFPGYKLAASGSTELPAVVSDGDTIYVIYTRNSYTVNYDLAGGMVPSGTVLTYPGLPYGSATPTISNPYLPGYEFTGWTPVWSAVVTGNITYTATYRQNNTWPPYDPPYTRPSNTPVTDETTTIEEEEVPLAELPGLNTVDHYAYIAGYEDGTVQPEGNITRAEVATIFFRLFTDEYRELFWSTTNSFNDVASNAWYNNAVSTTSNAGIINGYPDGSFKPDNYITRAEFATIAANFLSSGYEGLNQFSDISGHWAADYINRAAEAGWISGYEDGTFRPDAYITRAEAMTLVNNMLGRMPHEDHLLADMIVWPDNPKTAWHYEAVQEATNSHDYEWVTEEERRLYEIWTALEPNRDWATLEQEWSNAHSAPGGEVIG